MPRAKKLPAGMRQRKDGTYEQRFTVDGKRYSVYASTINDALAAAGKKRQELEAGIVQPSTITLNQYYDEWIERKKTSVREVTIKTYNDTYTVHIRDTLGKKKLHDLERKDFTNLQASVASTVSNTRANYAMLVIKMILKEAVADDLIPKNPAESVRRLPSKSAASETIHRALSKEEQTTFMKALKETEKQYYPFFALMLSTGIRYGEARALYVTDIDLVAGMLHVRRTITQKTDGKEIAGAFPKSDAGVRDIPLGKTICEVMKGQVETAKAVGSQYLFPGEKKPFIGKCVGNDVINRVLKKLNRQGVHIEPFTTHCMRDTFATRWIETRDDYKTLQKILGHASLSMTMDIYAHVLESTKRQAIDALSIDI